MTLCCKGERGFCGNMCILIMVIIINAALLLCPVYSLKGKVAVAAVPAVSAVLPVVPLCRKHWYTTSGYRTLFVLRSFGMRKMEPSKGESLSVTMAERKKPRSASAGKPKSNTGTAETKKRRRMSPMAMGNAVVQLRNALIHRNQRRKYLIEKFKEKRARLKIHIKEAKSMDERIHWHYKLQQLPRDSCPVRYRNRCLITGRPRGYSRFFGVSRHVARRFIQELAIPGVTKDSW